MVSFADCRKSCMKFATILCVGFIFANEFLMSVEPAYSPDIPLTYAYRRMLQDYLNIKLMARIDYEKNEDIAVDLEINKPAV